MRLANVLQEIELKFRFDGYELSLAVLLFSDTNTTTQFPSPHKDPAGRGPGQALSSLDMRAMGDRLGQDGGGPLRRHATAGSICST